MLVQPFCRVSFLLLGGCAFLLMSCHSHLLRFGIAYCRLDACRSRHDDNFFLSAAWNYIWTTSTAAHRSMLELALYHSSLRPRKLWGNLVVVAYLPTGLWKKLSCTHNCLQNGVNQASECVSTKCESVRYLKIMTCSTKWQSIPKALVTWRTKPSLHYKMTTF